jgi:ABC-2 type transport system ATP-binding protein
MWGGDSALAAMISLNGISKHYGEYAALRNVTCDIESGSMVALLGPNGAGKTTLISLLLGLRRADSGQITIEGNTPQQAVRRGQVGSMLQGAGLPNLSKVVELVSLFATLYPNPLHPDEALERAGILDLRTTPVERLSGGQVQRVRFALAIVGQPSIILLDEPTVGMDIQSRQSFWESMREWSDATRTLLFSSHYLDEVDAVADRVVLLNKGHLIADAAPSELKRQLGATTVTFKMIGASTESLGELPGVLALAINENRVTLRTKDADAVVSALFANGTTISDLQIQAVPLEEIVLRLSQDAETTP